MERYLADLVDRARGVLGAQLVGAYVAGSLALNAFEPGRSDIDAALVCADALPLERKQALVAALRHESLPCPARGLELVVYRDSIARSGTSLPGFEVDLNTGARMDFRVTWSGAERTAADGRFWYGLDRSILHQSGLSLLGPPAASAFGDLTRDDLGTLLTEALTWWLAQPPAAADDAVLGACRSLCKWRDGVWLSKVAAGRRLSGEEVVARALLARAGGLPPSAPEARAFQRKVLDEISADRR